MKKYFRIFILSIQRNFQQRASLIGWFLVGLLPSFVFIATWFTILGRRDHIGSFTRSDFILYYLGNTFLWYIIGGTFSYDLSEKIKNGVINKSLLKPFNFILESFFSEQGWKITSLSLALPILVVAIYLLRHYIVWHFSWALIVPLITSVILGAIIFALLQGIVWCLAFWIHETWVFADLNFLGSSLFGGSMAPLILLPSFFYNLAQYLPYKYIFYVPLTILLQKNTHPFYDLFIQFAFCILLFEVLRLMQHFGVKHYEAIGG